MTRRKPDSDPELMTLRALAVLVGVTPDSLRQRIHRGTLRAYKVGPVWVVPVSEATRVLAGRSAPAQP